MNVTVRGRTRHFRTVSFDAKRNAVVLIEQRLLPHQFKLVATRDYRDTHRRMVLGLLVILALGYVLLRGVAAVLPSYPERLGLERQRAATLTLVRRSIQQGHYGLLGVEHDERTMVSAEGKTFLALFPVFGRVFDQDRFARDRPALLAELMYRDWDEQNGAAAFSAYQAAARDVAALPDARDGAAWLAAMRQKVGCFDCELQPDMNRERFGRELFKWNQAHNVKQAVETFGSARHFQSGRDGERAARTYWVPIWALMFSMFGAFTHIFKLIFTVTEYVHRLTFHQIGAADSPLAQRVIRNSRSVTAAVVIGMGLFVYFADNRVTGHERYAEMRPRMWRTSPVVGGIAAHWTVNAQGLLYPFTRKIRPAWLRFDSDPLALLPFAKALGATEEE